MAFLFSDLDKVNTYTEWVKEQQGEKHVCILRDSGSILDYTKADDIAANDVLVIGKYPSNTVIRDIKIFLGGEDNNASCSNFSATLLGYDVDTATFSFLNESANANAAIPARYCFGCVKGQNNSPVTGQDISVNVFDHNSIRINTNSKFLYKGADNDPDNATVAKYEFSLLGRGYFGENSTANIANVDGFITSTYIACGKPLTLTSVFTTCFGERNALPPQIARNRSSSFDSFYNSKFYGIGLVCLRNRTAAQLTASRLRFEIEYAEPIQSIATVGDYRSQKGSLPSSVTQW